MATITASPSRYIQQKGALSHLIEYTGLYGSSPLILITDSGRKRNGGKIEKSAGAHNTPLTWVSFNRECSQNEIDRIIGIVKKQNCDVIVGVGGGKTLDTAKAVAHFAKLPVVIVPTIASTDAPCSALSVIYTPEGVFESYLFLPANPNAVIMDTDVIAQAPARLLVSGMGDALATYFEARACKRSNADNCVGGKGSLSAMALAKLCYDTLLEDGFKALASAERKVVTQALEHVVEANTYLSGIGFESGGLAAAHAIHNGLTAIEATHSMYHGEKVAFGTLCQLVLENAPLEEMEEVIAFCLDVGLPVTLEDLGIKEVKPEEIRQVAKLSTAEGETIANMPVPVTEESVYAAIMTADALGHAYKE